MTGLNPVTPDTPVEDLVAEHPAAIRFLAQRHILCVVCGEVFWGSVGALIAQKGLDDPDAIVAELNKYLAGPAGDQPHS